MILDAKIDSFRLAVPLHKATVKNEDKYTDVIVNKRTGDIKSEIFRGFQTEKDGIKSSFGFWHNPNTLEKMLVMNIHSKQLGAKYFDGINPDSILLAYHYVMKLNKDFHVPLDVFMNGKVYDLDICQDSVLCPYNHFKKIAEELYQLSKDIGLNTNNVAKFENKAGLKQWTGIQYSTRETQDKKNPFIKWYHKGWDLSHHSSEFAKAHLQGIDYKNIVRMEATTPTSQIVNEFGLNKLNHILEQNKTPILENRLNTYFGDTLKNRTMTNKQIEDLKSIDRTYLAMIKKLSLYGESLDDIVWTITELHRGKYKKTAKRIEKRIRELYYEYMVKDSSKKSIQNYLKMMVNSN